MLWKKHKDVDVDVQHVRVYKIKPGSALDSPKTLYGKGVNYEDALEEHFLKQDSGNMNLLSEMYEIYKIYDSENCVNLISCQNKVLKRRHEKVVIEFIKKNAEHLRHLKSYLK